MENVKTIKENKMGIMPVNKLLITMALPMMLSMLIQALYNIVDSYFVAQISPNALTAVSLAFPIQTILIGINAGTGVGINALLSRRLGQKDYNGANKVAGNAITIAFFGYFIMLIFGLFFARGYFMSQTDNPEIISMGTSYISICTIFSIGVFVLITFEKLLQSTGRTLHSMCCQMIGAIINIILDPILIFGYFGFPKMGIEGAAWATVIGQIIAAGIAILINVKLNRDLKIKLSNLKPDFKIIKGIYSVGFPSILMNCTVSVMVYFLNNILIGFSTTAANVLGVYFKLQSFIFMPIFGMNNGIVPIIAYNYGARNKNRIITTMRLGMIYATILMLIGMAVMMIFPESLMRIFDDTEALPSMGGIALRIISISYITAGFNIVALSICQAMGYGILSMIVSFVRQLAVLLPAATILSNLFGLNAIWWAFPIAESFTLVLCIFFLKKIYHKKIHSLSST